MDFIEFTRMLGAEPQSRDPEFLAARESSEEFRKAAEAAEQFERKLVSATNVGAPADLLQQLSQLADQPVEDAPARQGVRWKPLAMAAGLLMAVGAAGLGWNLTHSWDSVEEYLVAHYAHDGEALLAQAGGNVAGNVQETLAGVDFEATDAFSGQIAVIKYCPTPGGKGVHLVLNTEQGPVTVILMPETEVNDRETISIGGQDAYLVALETGSAAIIGPGSAYLAGLDATVRNGFLSAASKA